MECNKCHKLDPDYVAKLNLFDVDKGIKCRHCNNISPSKSWSCPCGNRWFLCDKDKWITSNTARVATENPDGEIKNKVARKHSIGPKPRVPRVMVRHQEMLMEDLNAESEKLIQTHNVKTRKMSHLMTTLPGGSVRVCWGRFLQKDLVCLAPIFAQVKKQTNPDKRKGFKSRTETSMMTTLPGVNNLACLVCFFTMDLVCLAPILAQVVARLRLRLVLLVCTHSC